MGGCFAWRGSLGGDGYEEFFGGGLGGGGVIKVGTLPWGDLC